MTLKKIFLDSAAMLARGRNLGFVGLFDEASQGNNRMQNQAHKKMEVFKHEEEDGTVHFGWGYTPNPYKVDRKEMKRCMILALCFAAAMVS